jgi:hypothetical protein
MEFFYVENEKYIPKCPECSEIVGFKINFKDLNISIECRNGHNKNKISCTEFKENYIRPSHIYINNCYNCFETINEENNNYKCTICNKLFCSNCIIRHMLQSKHNSKIKFIQQYQLCQDHNQKYTMYCLNCKKNICYKCHSSHQDHSKKSIFNIIPSKTQKDSIKVNSKELWKKINEISSLVRNYKEDIDRKYEEIKSFFDFLKEINKTLLNNFNYNYFDYYNYANFNYLMDFKNSFCFDLETYKNYLILKKDEKKHEKINEKIAELIINKKKDLKDDENNKDSIQSLSNLEYLKENIFYAYESHFIKFFEFKNFSFKKILSYDLGKFKIENIRSAKYNNSILINFKLKKNIKFLEYDLINKTIKLSKQEIKSKTIGFDKYFYRYFDNKNGNILTQDSMGVTVWKMGKKKYFDELITINEAYLSLFSITENLFCFQDVNYNIYFYDTENYKCNKIIEYSQKINVIGTINNEVIIFINNSGNKMFLVDIKYLEIIQFIDNDSLRSNTRIKDNYLLIFNMEKEKQIKIVKKTFDLKEKYFNNTEIIEKETKLNDFEKILITDSDYIVILNYNSMILLHL